MIKLADVEPDYEAFTHVFADTETTGVDKYAEVVEVTMTEFNKKGELGATITYMCEPMAGFIPAGASKVNGIHMDDVRGFPSYLRGGVREDCASFLGKRCFCAHNADFDVKMMKIKPAAIDCSLSRARKMWPSQPNNLKAACIRAGISWNEEEAHRASYDVSKGVELMLYLWNTVKVSNNTFLDDI